MRCSEIGILVLAACSIATQAQSQSLNRCAALQSATLTGVEITQSEPIPAGKTIPPAYPGASAVGPLPAHCRVDGMINRRKGSDGEEFGIGFSIALPEPSAWNGDFMMQGGGGGNGIVAYPTGASYTGDKPALSRGFAVASTDSGHKAKTGGFDFTFMRDQQAYLDFAYMANAEVAGVAKQIIEPSTTARWAACRYRTISSLLSSVRADEAGRPSLNQGTPDFPRNAAMDPDAPHCEAHGAS